MMYTVGKRTFWSLIYMLFYGCFTIYFNSQIKCYQQKPVENCVWIFVFNKVSHIQWKTLTPKTALNLGKNEGFLCILVHFGDICVINIPLLITIFNLIFSSNLFHLWSELLFVYRFVYLCILMHTNTKICSWVFNRSLWINFAMQDEALDYAFFQKLPSFQ